MPCGSNWGPAARTGALKPEGEQPVEGPMVAKLIRLKDVQATLAMLRTPDGQGIELDMFHTPAVAGRPNRRN